MFCPGKNFMYRYCGMYILAALLLVCLDVIVMSSA